MPICRRRERPARPVLFYNPLSGGGKAARFHLADEARKRGIEPIELRRGQDLEELVRDAVQQGADALAMAGGDGSQAVVAMIAAELDLPYACIPAGTRNHFALDLGVDRDDVVGALDAFVNGGERRVDLAEVNGRVFVNNVSLGLYAEAVQQPGYREAKLHTLLETVPDSVGPDAKPPDLMWDSPEGEQSAVAILISNNAYRLGRALGSGTRPRLDRAVLGVTVLAPTKSGADGTVSRRLAMEQWITPTFEIGSGCEGGCRDRRRGHPPRSAASLPDPSRRAAGQDRAAASGRLPVGARARPAMADDRCADDPADTRWADRRGPGPVRSA